MDYDKLYSREELEKMSTEDLLALKDRSKYNASKLLTQQVVKKVLINSLYGAIANTHFCLFNEKIAQAITGNGRYFIQMTANNIENYLQSKHKSDKPYILYGDTDSCVGDTIIETKHGRTTIEKFYNKTTGNENLYTPNGYVKKPQRKLYVKSLSKDLKVEYKEVKYIMKHTVKKRMFKIKTHGREVIITEDHSIMVIRNNILTSVKAKYIEKTDKIIFIGNFDDCDLTDEERKMFEIKALEVETYFNKNNYSTQALWKTYIPSLIKQKYKGDWIKRCLDIRKYGLSTASKEKWILLYGEDEGNKKFNEYKERQVYTNSQEYKNMTDEEFDEYNKSRAVTKDLCIKRYGEDEGIKIWNQYRQKQSYTNSEKYFIEQYGLEKGKEKYKLVNKLKSHTLESYELITGNKEEAFKLYKNYWEVSRGNTKTFYSKIASSIFRKLENELNIEHCYYAPKTKEFGLYCECTKKYMFYDFVIPDKKICIEYNGNCFHANPKLYKENDHPNPYNKNITAKEIWENDKIKINNIKKHGYNVIIIWENDYDFEHIKSTVKELMQ